MQTDSEDSYWCDHHFSPSASSTCSHESCLVPPHFTQNTTLIPRPSHVHLQYKKFCTNFRFQAMNTQSPENKAMQRYENKTTQACLLYDQTLLYFLCSVESFSGLACRPVLGLYTLNRLVEGSEAFSNTAVCFPLRTYTQTKTEKFSLHRVS